MNLQKDLIKRYSRALDVILECVDARVPGSSSNLPYISSVTSKPVIVALTHSDLADPSATRRWLDWFAAKGYRASEVNCLSGPSVSRLMRQVKPTAKTRGLRPPRLVVVGMPNVGKSSLINRIAGTSVARVGAKPGITRGPQWVKCVDGWELLDTPGVLDPNAVGAEPKLRLAAVGILSEGSYELEEAGAWLLDYLRTRVPDRVRGRYGTDGFTLAEVAEVSGFRLPDGDADLTRAASRVLADYRKGLLGRVTLEMPEG